jgi:hypothetical protein
VACINGWFSRNANIKAKLPKFVMAVPDCSHAMSPFQDRPITVLFAEAGTDRDTHHIPRGDSRFPTARGLVSGPPPASSTRYYPRLPLAAFNAVD